MGAPVANRALGQRKGLKIMKKKFIRLVLAKEDADLVSWKKSLPPKTFTETVNKILVSESVGQIAHIPYEFSSAEVAEEDRTGFYVDNENVLALLSGIHKGDRTDVIKEIIRKHIQHNCEHPPELVSVELLYNILVDFRTKMAAKEAGCVGVADKYRKLRDTYDFGTRELFNAILACYQSGDEKVGDQQMKSLDVDQIVNQAFKRNFGVHFKSIEDDDV